ncbi:MAG TPA: ribosomal protein S18-alanine N-acetyltransferase [Anaerolineales bacterium]|nr:ribosomal protein S18-alanine N-acetyltransferase [Anaerolineales bacterium]
MIPETLFKNLVIRTMKAADLPRVGQIDQQSFALPWPARSFRYELLENEGSLLWAAEAEIQTGERQVIGAIVVWMILDEAHIATLAVDPAYRGKGIGAALMAEALSGAIHHGATQATLEVRVQNLAAQKLYRRFGFEIVGRRFRYYQDNQEDALIMTTGRLDGPYQHWLESGGWKTQVWNLAGGDNRESA